MSRRIGFGRHTPSEDLTGDPLDGLVNLFDIGIVLAVAFLIAGLGLTLNSAKHQLQPRSTAGESTTALPAPTGAPVTSGRGEAVGTVYRLPSGQLIYVHAKSR